MSTAVTFEQMRLAVLEVLSGRIQPPPGVLFDNYANLKIGARAALAKRGILEPQPPFPYLADNALAAPAEITYKRVYDALVAEGVLAQKHGSDEFTVELLPPPFSQRWQYLAPLGGGGQGTASKVARLTDGVLGALKVPRSTEPVATKRFVREVSILGELDHPSIVRLLDSNLDPAAGVLGCVTPFGQSLDAYWSERTGSLNPKDRYDLAFDILHRVAEGLALLHAKGAVHRDIKPENVIMICDRPVIIDFGVAKRPEDERLSVADGRVVANSFATPASAHYGLHEGGPAWDCLGLAWLYGFLVGEGQRPKQFHWKFHPLTEEPRKDRAKAILAACSHEHTVPSDAKAFMELMSRFRLGGGEHAVPVSTDARTAAAEAAHLEAQAAAMVRAANHTELAEVSIQILEGPLQELRSALNRLCVGNANLPVQQNTHPDDDGESFEPPVMPNQPMRDVLQHVARGAKEGFESEQCIFSCACGSGLRKFHIGVFVSFTLHHVEDGLPFRLIMWCRLANAKGPEWPDLLLNLRKDGSFEDYQNEKILDAEGVAMMAYGWMTDPFRWTAIG